MLNTIGTNPYFLAKNKKNITKCPLKFLPSMQSGKYPLVHINMTIFFLPIHYVSVNCRYIIKIVNYIFFTIRIEQENAEDSSSGLHKFSAQNWVELSLFTCLLNKLSRQVDSLGDNSL